MTSARIFGSDLPEVVPDGGPQVLAGEPPEVVSSESKPEYEKHATLMAPAQAKPPFWRTRKARILAVVAVIVVAAAVIGTAVGVTVNKRSSSEPSQDSAGTEGEDTGFGSPMSSPPESTSICRGTVCPSMLAAASSSAENSSSFFIFALGKDDALWYRGSDGEQWLHNWTSLGGSFTSQPAAVSMEPGRVDVFGVWSDLSMRTKTYKDGTWEDGWTNLLGSCKSPPTVCSMSDGRMDLFTLDTSQYLAHKWFNDGEWVPGADTSDWNSTNGFISASPVATCGGEDRFDVTVYGAQKDPHDVVFKRWNGTRLSKWNSQGGSYQGDPAAIALGPNRTDFLGVGTDMEAYHLSYIKSQGYSDTSGGSIGGKFESVLAMVSTQDNRIDAFGVSTDGRLKHKALVGSTWGTEWEDLGGFFNSAPLPVKVGSDAVIIFGIGPGGSIIHGKWKVGDAYSWENATWFEDGGSFSTTWYRSGPA